MPEIQGASFFVYFNFSFFFCGLPLFFHSNRNFRSWSACSNVSKGCSCGFGNNSVYATFRNRLLRESAWPTTFLRGHAGAMTAASLTCSSFQQVNLMTNLFPSLRTAVRTVPVVGLSPVAKNVSGVHSGVKNAPVNIHAVTKKIPRNNSVGAVEQKAGCCVHNVMSCSRQKCPGQCPCCRQKMYRVMSTLSPKIHRILSMLSPKTCRFMSWVSPKNVPIEGHDSTMQWWYSLLVYCVYCVYCL